MYFPHAFRKDFFVQSSATGCLNSLISSQTPTVGATGLTAGQVAFFRKKSAAGSDSTLESFDPTSSTTPFIIAQGSYFVQDKIGPVHGGYSETLKSKLVNPHYISRVIKVVAKQARQMVVQVPVTCGLTCDTTYRLRVDVKGSPALRFLSHNMYRTLDSYTGCCSTVDPTLQKDPVPTLLNWADQINLSPIFNTMVQARVYKLAVTNTTTSANGTSISTTQATFVPGAFTSIAVGQKVVGTGIPANSFVTTVNGTTNITITYPAQQTAPAASVFNALSIKYYNDLYSGNQGTFSYPATVAGGSATVPTVIPGTGSQNPTLGASPGITISSGVATGANIAQNLAGTTNGAIVYLPLVDAASFTVDAHIELVAAYMETKFGDCTFTPSDKYDLEPLFIYTSLTDESGDPCVVNCFTTTHSNGQAGDTTANLATVIQPPIQASGVGETVLRNLILSGRYLQNAYPDSSRVESLRMREIEADPMYAAISRTALYDQIMVLHSVPRFNNPTGTFDNDQYLLVINVPTNTTTTAFTSALVGAANTAQGSGTITLETY
jgi:hypothetical protein